MLGKVAKLGIETNAQLLIRNIRGRRMLDSLKLHMMLEPTDDGRWSPTGHRPSVASVLELPDYRVEGKTEAEAIDGLRILVTERFARSNILPLEVPMGDVRSAVASVDENPWVKFAGVFKDDPYFADIAEELRQERRLGERP
jgi:hypothetical protein